MLKAWVQNQDIAEIDIEEKYVSFVRTLRTDRYTTVRAQIKKKIKNKFQKYNHIKNLKEILHIVPKKQRDHCTL